MRQIWASHSNFALSIGPRLLDLFEFVSSADSEDAKRKSKRLLKRLELLLRLCKAHVNYICDRDCTAPIPLSCLLMFISEMSLTLLNKIEQSREALAVFSKCIHDPESRTRLEKCYQDLQDLVSQLKPYCKFKKIALSNCSVESRLPFMSLPTLIKFENAVWWDYIDGHYCRRDLPNTDSLTDAAITKLFSDWN